MRGQVVQHGAEISAGGQAVLSVFLKRMLRVLPLYDRPKSWWLRLWQLACGGKHGSSLALVAATGSFLKAVLDSPDLNRRCMALMDVGTMLGTVFYQVTFTNRRSWTRGMLEDLVRLSEEVEADAGPEAVDDLRGTVRSMRRIFNFMVFFVVTVTALMLLTPMAGELTMSIYPQPEGVFWYLACFTQEAATFMSSMCVGTIMFTLLLVSFGVASLARCISLKLQTCHGEAAMVALVRLHREVTDVGNTLADTYFLTLFCLITGYLTVSLLGTFNVATGSFDPYTVLIVPGALLFYFNIAVISDVLYTSTASVSEAAWGCPWTEESVPVRRLVLNMITRAQRAASVRVPLLGAVTLPVFMDSMRQWYSFLQMIRNINH